MAQSDPRVGGDVIGDTDRPIDGIGPVGLGGWLVLPFLGILLTATLTVVQLIAYKDIGAAWPYLTAGQAAFIVGDLVGCGVIGIVAPIGLVYFFFKRSELFPGLYIVWAIALPIFLILETWLYGVFLAALMDPGEQAFDSETVRDITKSAISAAIWVTYMNRSRRVANTFVN